MSLNESVIEGTLKPDGTLELDQKPNLPPGRVKVTVQTEDWLSYLKRCRAELESSAATSSGGRSRALSGGLRTRPSGRFSVGQIRPSRKGRLPVPTATL